jgi:HSP20 family molecular chaperone IbpA
MRQLSTAYKPFAIGFDKLFDMFDAMGETSPRSPSYPPYNLIKVDETNFKIQIAVAGYTEKDLNVELDGTTLIVSGEQVEPMISYIHKGISTRKFTLKFTLAETIKLKPAVLDSGILTIELTNVVQKDRVKKIDIFKSTAKPEDYGYLGEGL